MARLDILGGTSACTAFRFRDEISLGRRAEGLDSLENVVALSDGRVSRQHARIKCQGDAFFIEDLNSTNGTLLRGQRIQPGFPYPLHDGDEIGICSTRLVFHTADAESATGEEMAEKTDSAGGMAGWNGSLSLKLVSDDQARSGFTAVLEASSSVMELGGIEHGAEKYLQTALKRLQAISQVSVALGAVTDPDRLMPRILDYIFDIFPTAQRAFILLQERGTEALVRVAAKQRGELPGQGGQVAISRTIINEVIRHKRAILSWDAMGDARFKNHTSSIASLSIRSVMCAPLLVADEILGLIQVDTPRACNPRGAGISGIDRPAPVPGCRSLLGPEV